MHFRQAAKVVKMQPIPTASVAPAALDMAAAEPGLRPDTQEQEAESMEAARDIMLAAIIALAAPVLGLPIFTPMKYPMLRVMMPGQPLKGGEQQWI